MDNKKELIQKYECILSFFYRIMGRNHWRVSKGNTIKTGYAFMKRCSIQVLGTDNNIIIEPGITRLTNSSFFISGNHCRIRIMGGANLKEAHLHIEDDGGSIIIGSHTAITGYTELACIEGKTIKIGNNSLFSNDIVLRTGDSHSVLNAENGERLNPSEDIVIGEHVWIGQGVKILKGVKIGNDSIVSTGAILTKKDYPANCVCGGVGGKVLKTGVTWTYQRI